MFWIKIKNMKSVLCSMLLRGFLFAVCSSGEFVQAGSDITSLKLSSMSLKKEEEIRVQLKFVRRKISEEEYKKARMASGKNLYVHYTSSDQEYIMISRISATIAGKNIDFPVDSYAYFLDPNVDLGDVTIWYNAEQRIYILLIGCSENEAHHVGEIEFDQSGVISSVAYQDRVIWKNGTPTGMTSREEVWKFNFRN